MKSVAMGIIFICAVILGSSILMTMEGKSIREQEMNDVLSVAFRQEGRKLLEETTGEQLENRIYQRVSREIKSEGEIKVQVLVADADLGMLAVRVMETYAHPNGQQGKLEMERAFILDKMEESEQELTSFCQVDFLVDGMEYRSYQMKPGQRIRIPASPERMGYRFLGWTNGEEKLEEDWMMITSTASYEAKYEKEGEDDGDKE